MMRSFGKAYKDRTHGLREGPIYIFFQTMPLLMGSSLFLWGVVVAGLTGHYTNDNLSVDMQACPALEGLLHSWIATMGYACIALGVLGLSAGGLLPKILLLFQLRDEAICCGQLFMGLLGKILGVVGFTGLILYNVHGTFVIREANRSGVQSEASWPLDMAKTYCSSVILILFKIMNYGVYALFGGCVAMSFVFCYIKVNKYRTETAPLPEFGVEATKMAEVLELFLEKKHRKKARKPTKVAKHRNVKKA